MSFVTLPNLMSLQNMVKTENKPQMETPAKIIEKIDSFLSKYSNLKTSSRKSVSYPAVIGFGVVPLTTRLRSWEASSDRR